MLLLNQAMPKALTDMKELLLVVRPPTQNDLFHYFIDSPKASILSNKEEISIRGWAFPNDPNQEISLFIKSNGIRKQLNFNQPRPDVINHFKNRYKIRSPLCGFEVSIQNPSETEIILYIHEKQICVLKLEETKSKDNTEECIKIINNRDLLVCTPTTETSIAATALAPDNQILKTVEITPNLEKQNTTTNEIILFNFFSKIEHPINRLDIVFNTGNKITGKHSINLFHADISQAEKYLFGDNTKNRSIYLENNAFTTYQLSKYFNHSRSINCSAAVIFAYNSIDLKSLDLCNIAAYELKNNLQKIHELAPARHIRRDKYHLTLSMLTALWHIALATSDGELFINSLDEILKITITSDNSFSPVYGASILNKTKSLGILSLTLHLLNEKDSAHIINNKLLASAQGSFLSYNNDEMDRIFLHEFRLAHADLVDILILGTFNESEEPQGWFKANIANLNHTSFIQKILSNCIRARQGKEWLIENYHKLMRNDLSKKNNLKQLSIHNA